MDNKKPIIITAAIIGALIIALVAVIVIRSCNRVEDQLLPTGTTVTDTSGSDMTSGSDNTDVTDMSGETLPSQPSDGPDTPIVPPVIDDGEVIITETTQDGTRNTPTPRPAGSSSAAAPTSSPASQSAAPSETAPTLPNDGVIELPFVPADAL
ncbi:hypothetical protein SAMN02910456_01620 [Ruminococcaceae bacterium YRB3002]|nr:hypothetical protein SAMN02910456_01620 [Ruminococcaceae bacterium YRB3002]